MTMHHRGIQIARLNKILLTGIMGGSAFGARRHGAADGGQRVGK